MSASKTNPSDGWRFTISRARRLGPESNDCDDRQHNGNNEDRELRKFEWRFRLCWSQRMQGRYFFKQLHDQYKQVEVETYHRTDHVDPAPCSNQMLGTARENCDREKWKRNNSETDGWRKSVKGKEESSKGCQNRRGQKP